MQLVSASKLRKAQEQAQSSRDYRIAAYALLARLNQIHEVDQQPLFRKRPIKTKLYIVITSNSGLAGAYNANALKLLAQAARNDSNANVQTKVITIGNKGSQFVRRLKDVELLAHYPAFGDEPTESDIRPVLSSVIDEYKNEHVDEVHLIYTDFRSTISQTATDLPLLPAHLDADAVAEAAKQTDVGLMNFEPDVETVVHNIASRLIELQIWQAILESLASEHSMRMLAMKNATDNAGDLIQDYTLEYNTARQAAITQELAEISGGAEAMNA
jgi:F-type H+-transporting ATPase subunit gamma